METGATAARSGTWGPGQGFMESSASVDKEEEEEEEQQQLGDRHYLPVRSIPSNLYMHAYLVSLGKPGK